jgi:hypothetical protein
VYFSESFIEQAQDDPIHASTRCANWVYGAAPRR